MTAVFSSLRWRVFIVYTLLLQSLFTGFYATSSKKIIEKAVKEVQYILRKRLVEFIAAVNDTIYTIHIYPSVHTQLIRTLPTLFEAYIVASESLSDCTRK